MPKNIEFIGFLAFSEIFFDFFGIISRITLSINNGRKRLVKRSGKQYLPTVSELICSRSLFSESN